jgi:hypothetical protein
VRNLDDDRSLVARRLRHREELHPAHAITSAVRLPAPHARGCERVWASAT